MVKKYGVDNGAASSGSLLKERGIKTHNLENEARDRHTLNQFIVVTFYVHLERRKKGKAFRSNKTEIQNPQ